VQAKDRNGKIVGRPFPGNGKRQGGELMYEKILIPLDGSALSETVLAYTKWFAHALQVSVELLHVNDPTQLAPFSPPLQGSEYLKKIAASFPGVPDIKCTVELGNPADTIIDIAAAEPASLIAMATHGYSGAKRWLLGSVAEKVLRGAKNDLLLLRSVNGTSSGSAEFKTILAPLDTSPLAEEILPVVAELGLKLELPVALVHVVKHFYSAPPEAFLPVFGANPPNLKRLREEARAEANRYLSEKAVQLRAQGLTHVEAVVVDGGADGAAAAIIDLAEKTENGLIVMSSHGGTDISRWLIGSVTERVVRHSNGPVLVIRPRS
jgi:nucleotide-binding universal stress UspA family protein